MSRARDPHDDPQRRAAPGPAVLAPTIGRLKAMGVGGFQIVCARAFCLRAAYARFETAALPDETPFPEIARRRRFVCASCGGREVSIAPDWRGYRARGVPG